MSKRKPIHMSIPECPAAEICRTKKADCAVCEDLEEAVWREHVRAVIGRTATTG